MVRTKTAACLRGARADQCNARRKRQAASPLSLQHEARKERECAPRRGKADIVQNTGRAREYRRQVRSASQNTRENRRNSAARSVSSGKSISDLHGPTRPWAFANLPEALRCGPATRIRSALRLLSSAPSGRPTTQPQAGGDERGDQREISGGVGAIAGNASGNSQPDFRVFNAHEINEIKGFQIPMFYCRVFFGMILDQLGRVFLPCSAKGFPTPVLTEPFGGLEAP